MTVATQVLKMIMEKRQTAAVQKRTVDIVFDTVSGFSW
jgi:hypothetical protein